MGFKKCRLRISNLWFQFKSCLGCCYDYSLSDEDEEEETKNGKGIKKTLTRLWSNTHRHSGSDFYYNLTSIIDENGEEDDEFFNGDLSRGPRVHGFENKKFDANYVPSIMHRPGHSSTEMDKFGTLRFRTKLLDKEVLSITIVDAKDLPPMDANGKADPYVEISIRPGPIGKASTIIKPCSLNPIFNETFHLKIHDGVKSDSELVLKVMDSDFPQQDELIGVISLPLEEVCHRSVKEYSCLILHEKNKSGDMINVTDAAKLNFKISSLRDEITELKKKLNYSESVLAMLRTQNDKLRVDAIESVLYFDQNQEEVEEPIDGKKDDKTRVYSLLKSLKFSLEDKDEEISTLKTQVAELKSLLVTSSAIWGQLELGLSYFALGAKLRIDIISARNLKPVNLFGNHSDPYVKLKVHLDRSHRMNSRPSSSMSALNIRKMSASWDKWEFHTKTCWKTRTPSWNEHFIIPDEITTRDLDHISLEFIVKDDARIRKVRPLGALLIFPDSEHWSNMISNQGTIVKKYHNLVEI